jgi:hypothetical protein
VNLNAKPKITTNVKPKITTNVKPKITTNVKPKVNPKSVTKSIKAKPTTQTPKTITTNVKPKVNPKSVTKSIKAKPTTRTPKTKGALPKTQRKVLKKYGKSQGIPQSFEQAKAKIFKDTQKQIKTEQKFTKQFIKEYFVSIHDDYPFEYVAQVNYLFYQERFKSLGLNLICFDLFESYVDPNFVKNNYRVDKNVYITYGNKTMNDYLIKYEIKNCKNDEIGVWEYGNKRPDLAGKIFHPNQHGYKIYIDYLFNQILKNKYSFKK